MTDFNSLAENEAIEWVIRTQAVDFDDWSGLEAWLATSSENASRFNALVNFDAALANHMSNSQRNPFHGSGNDFATGHRGAAMNRRSVFGFVGGGLLAASLAAVIVFQGNGQVTVSTAPGEQREIELDSGVNVALNGGTEISYEKSDPRTIRIVSGEALFDVEHGSGKPLKIIAGQTVMRDLGTVFNVVHSERLTQLSVSQGVVLFDGNGSGMRVNRGEGVRFESGNPKAARFTLPPEAVAGWRSGRFVYRNASIAEIGDDLTRRFGIKVHVDESVSSQRFTGSFNAEKDLQASLSAAGPLLGVTVINEGKQWVLRATTNPGS